MRFVHYLSLSLCCFFIQQANAQPDNLIDSLTNQKQLLNEKKEQATYQYEVARHNCYNRFFVNYCLKKAYSKMYSEKSLTQEEEVKIDDQIRQIKAKNRDEQAILRETRYDPSNPERLQNEQMHQAQYQEKEQSNYLNQTRHGEKPDEAPPSSSADFQKQVKIAEQQAKEDKIQRAKNVKRYQNKLESAAKNAERVKDRQKSQK